MKMWQLLMMAAAGNQPAAPATPISDLFSVDLWTGDGQNGRNIVTGLDMAGDGGLVWLKRRNASFSHLLHDSERTVTQALVSSSNGGGFTSVGGLQSFASNGFIVGSGPANGSNDPFVAWSFKKAAGFFDIVTYTGNGTAGRTVAHNLGSIPGMILVKGLSGRDWMVYHRGMDATEPQDYRLRLNEDSARSNALPAFNDTAPTATEFTLGTELDGNSSGSDYVAYLFAHDPTGNISCGSYIGNGSSAGQSIDLGWEPQFVMIKSVADNRVWQIWDNQRFESTTPARLFPNANNAEQGVGIFEFTSTGFRLTGSNSDVNGSGERYIYMAIKAE